jgi:hypothetical protein
VPPPSGAGLCVLRELGLGRRRGGGGLLGLGCLRSVLYSSGGVEFRLRVCLGDVELRSELRGLGGGLLLALLGARLGLLRLCAGERPVGACEFGVGAALEPFQLAHGCRERCRLARRRRSGFLGLVGRLDRRCGLVSKRRGTRRSSPDGFRVRLE